MPNSLKFGTSGLRGLAVDLVGVESRRYAAAFVRYLQQTRAGRRGAGRAGSARQQPGDFPPTVIGADHRRQAATVAVDCGELRRTPAAGARSAAAQGSGHHGHRQPYSGRP